MYLGIDLGTSGVKVILAKEDQSVIASATNALTQNRPKSGWSEQDPADWIAATRRAILNLRETHANELAALRAIGLSGQMHGATVLDATGAVLRPSILWNDTRAHIEAAKLDSQPAFRSITGNIVFPGFTAPKLLWMKSNEPDLFFRISKVLLPKDYLRYWLTGDFVTDMSDASGTSWLDVEARAWSDKLLTACDLDTGTMPQVIEGSDPGGEIRPDRATELGLPKGVIVAGGAGDNAASAIATGTVVPGQGFLSIGTSGVVFAANDAFRPNPQSAVHCFCHALPGLWHQMGVILSAAAALEWFASIVNVSPSALTEALGPDLRAPGRAMFLPYLAGERTPHNDAAIRGSFHGLGVEMDRPALTQAVLEGVAFAFRDNLEALQSTGTELAALTVVGGGIKSQYWLKALATVLNVPLHIPAHADYGAAFGAMRLAMLADGAGSVAEICRPPPVQETVTPDARLRAEFDAKYADFRAAYA